MKFKISICVLLVTGLFSYSSAVAETRPPKVACIINATGKIILSRKCKPATQTELASTSFTNPDSALSSRIDVTEASIAANGTDISTLTTTLGSHTTTLATNTANITSNTSSITTLSSSVATHATEIAANASDIAQLQPARVYTVAATGAQYATIAAAITAATTDGVSISAPAIISVAPGIYSVNSPLSPISGISIVGSGVGRTIVDNTGASPLIAMASNSALENLTLRKSGAVVGPMVNAVAVTGTVLRRMAIDVAGSSTSNVVSIDSSSVEINDVSISYNGTGSGVILVLSSDSTVIGRRLTVNTTAVSMSRGVVVQGTGSLTLHDSYIEANDTDFSATALQFADSVAGLLVNTRFKATSAGSFGPVAIYNAGSGSPRLLNSQVECGGATLSPGCIFLNDGEDLEIVNSRIDTNGSAALAAYAANSSTIKIGNSQIYGGSVSAVAGGTITCGGVTDEDFTFFASTCP